MYNGQGIDVFGLKYLSFKSIHFEVMSGKGKKQLAFDQVDIELAGPYAAEDADITLRLHHVLWSKLEKEPSLVSVFEDIEIPLMPIISHIERTGALIDADMLRCQSQSLALRMQELSLINI